MAFEDAEIGNEGEAENGEQGDHTEVLTLNSALSISFLCTNSVLLCCSWLEQSYYFIDFFKGEYFFLMKNCEFWALLKAFVFMFIGYDRCGI